MRATAAVCALVFVVAAGYVAMGAPPSRDVHTPGSTPVPAQVISRDGPTDVEVRAGMSLESIQCAYALPDSRPSYGRCLFRNGFTPWKDAKPPPNSLLIGLQPGPASRIAAEVNGQLLIIHMIWARPLIDWPRIPHPMALQSAAILLAVPVSVLPKGQLLIKPVLEIERWFSTESVEYQPIDAPASS